jgi:hypothetical protein
MNGAPRWIHKGFAVLFIVFCLELGLFLLVYPWTVPWKVNFIPALVPLFRPLWMNGYFRGAVSGLGMLNLWVALIELFRLRRFTPPSEE